MNLDINTIVDFIAFKKVRPMMFLAWIAVFVLLLRLPTVITPFQGTGDASTALIGTVLLDGGILYRDVVESRGPVTGYLIAAIFFFFGRNNMVAVHMVLTLLIILVAFILFLIGKTFTDDTTVGCWGGILFSVFSYTYKDFSMLSFQAEWLVILFESLGVYCLLKAMLGTIDRRILFLSGVFWGLALFSKQQALPNIVVATMFCLIFVYSKGQGLQTAGKVLIYKLAGILYVALSILSYFYRERALKDIVFHCWTYHVRYVLPLLSPSQKFRNFFAYFVAGDSFFSDNGLLLILFLAGVFMTWRRLFFSRQRPTTGSLVDLYLTFWGMTSLLSTGLSGNQLHNFHGNYYLLILPAFCLVGARALQDLFKILQFQNEKGTEGAICNKVLKKAMGIALIATLTTGLLVPLIKYSSRLLAGKVLLKHDWKSSDFVSSELSELTQYIKINSLQTDKIFVWGFYPQIYLLSERKMASRFRHCNYQTGLVHFINHEPGVDTTDNIVAGSWKVLMADLKRDQPLYIVDTSPGGFLSYGKYPPSRFKIFADYLEKNYFLEKVFSSGKKIASFKLYRRKK